MLTNDSRVYLTRMLENGERVYVTHIVHGPKYPSVDLSKEPDKARSMTLTEAYAFLDLIPADIRTKYEIWDDLDMAEATELTKADIITLVMGLGILIGLLVILS